MSYNVIGISSHFHDSACAILRDGQLVAAAQEERFSRRKHDASIPKLAFRYCLLEAGLTIADIDCVAYYENPREKLERQIWMMLPEIANRPAMLARFDSERPMREIRDVLGYRGPLKLMRHHDSHAASAFYFSGFTDSAILTVDSVGEWTTTAYGAGSSDRGIDLFNEVHFPHSVGLFYSTLTSYLGFEVNDGEYKVMGLAPYGRPAYSRQLERVIQLADDGQVRLDLRYFDFRSQQRMYSDELPAALGRPARNPGEPIEAFHQDVASSLQFVLERLLLGQVDYLFRRTGAESLCMAGGVALNCVANRAIAARGPFRRVFVQPAAGDAGGAVGAAALAHAEACGRRGFGRQLAHLYMGPSFTNAEIGNLLRNAGADAVDYQGREDELLAQTAERLAAGKVVGWFHGRMEFGPRALGARSILADPRSPGMRDRINSLVKKRESFRPFAPAVLLTRAGQHFDIGRASPFMLETCAVISGLDLPAITHVDGSARVQTVDPAVNPRFARLLECFERITGCPILLNTSFNMKDEPIVCTPEDAIICFLRSNLDTLVLEDFLLDRAAGFDRRTSILDKDTAAMSAAITHRVYTLI